MPDDFEIKELIMMNRAEVKDTCLTEYNEAETMELLREQAMQEGIEKGRLEKLVSLVFRKSRKNYGVSDIADMLEEDEGIIRKIYDAAKEYAPDYDEANCGEVLKRI
jgi:hypothetical protein